jgi:hypothetical protein
MKEVSIMEIAERNESGAIANETHPSIPHPNREQALKRARLTAGFPNIVNGQRIDSSRTIKISDPVTGEELASVTDTQKARSRPGGPGCKGSVSPLERQDLERAKGSSCKCHGRAQSSYR